MLLTIAAAIVGTVLAFVGVRALVAIAPADVPRLTLAAVNGRVLVTTMGLSLLIGLVFGLLPALQARRRNLAGFPRGRYGARLCGTSEQSRPKCAGRGRAGDGGGARLRRDVVDSEFLDAAAGESRIPDRWDPESGVPAAAVALPRRLPRLAELQGAACLQSRAAGARVCAPRCALGGTRGKSSARPGVHQLVHDCRSRGRVEIVAGDFGPPGEPVVLFHGGGRAPARPAPAGQRHHRSRSGRAHQHGRGPAILPGTRPAGRPHQLLGQRPDYRRDRRRREIPRHRRVVAYCGLRGNRSSALCEWRRSPARAHSGRALFPRYRGDGRNPPGRCRARRVRRRTAPDHDVALDRAAAIHHAAAGPVCDGGALPGGARHSRRPQLRGVATAQRNRDPSGAGCATI